MKRVIFIGQAMPRVKRDPHDWPSLNSWLYSMGISDDQIRKNFLYSALVDYFPGSNDVSHRIPTREEIEKERGRLSKTIKDFNPEVVVPVGRLSISYCLNSNVQPLSSHIGNTYLARPYLVLGKKLAVIPLPHPSGASTWYHKPRNKKLLLRALDHLKENVLND